MEAGIVVGTFKPWIGKHNILSRQVVKWSRNNRVVLGIVGKLLAASEICPHMTNVSGNGHVPDGVEVFIFRTHAFCRYAVVVESNFLDAKFHLRSLHLYIRSLERAYKRFEHQQQFIKTIGSCSNIVTVDSELSREVIRSSFIIDTLVAMFIDIHVVVQCVDICTLLHSGCRL